MLSRTPSQSREQRLSPRSATIQVARIRQQRDRFADEHTLKTRGLLRSGNGPHHAHPTENVLFSLGLYPVHPDSSAQQEKEH